MRLIILIVVIGTSIWVYKDAKSLGVQKGQTKGFFDVGPVGWAFCCLAFWVISFPLYLFKRRKFVEINSLPQRISERRSTKRIVSTTSNDKPLAANICKWIAVGWSLFCIVGIFFGFAKVGELSSGYSNDFEKAGAAIGTAIGMGLWFIVWVVVVGPTALIYFISGKQKKETFVSTTASASHAAEDDMKRCPYCAELIKAEAKICRYCKKDLPGERASQVEPKIEHRPKKMDWLQRGTAYLKRCEFKEAIIAFSTAIEKENDLQMAYYYRALAFTKINDKVRALSDLKMAAKHGNEKARLLLDAMGRRKPEVTK